jgi:hypothetical protein
VDSALSFNSGSSGEIEFSGTAGNVCITGALLQASHTLTLGTATISLGNTGAPSDPCVNGSIYTRSDGTVGASHYDCYGAVWHASAT